MSEAVSEALNREYHEKLGWKLSQSGPFHTWGGVRSGKPDWVTLPRLDEDANLCIAELDRVFGPDWLTVAIQESYLVAQYVWHDSVTLVIRNVHRGATFAEAALKCLIAAHKRESEEAV